MEEHFSLMRFIIEYLFLFFWLWPLPFSFSPPSLLQSSALVHHSLRTCRLNSSPVPSAWWGINHWLLSPLQRACGGHLKEVGDLLKTLRWMFVFLWNTCMFEFTILTLSVLTSVSCTREPSECGAILLRIWGSPGRMLAAHRRRLR